jgi:hypothetical protein
MGNRVGTWVTLDMVTFSQQTFVFGQEIHILNLYCVGIGEFTPTGMTKACHTTGF